MGDNALFDDNDIVKETPPPITPSSLFNIASVSILKWGQRLSAENRDCQPNIENCYQSL